MKKMKLHLFMIVFTLGLLATNQSFAQNTGQYLGLDYSLSYGFDDAGNHASLGLSYENRFAEHLGIETGFYNDNLST